MVKAKEEAAQIIASGEVEAKERIKKAQESFSAFNAEEIAKALQAFQDQEKEAVEFYKKKAEKELQQKAQLVDRCAGRVLLLLVKDAES